MDLWTWTSTDGNGFLKENKSIINQLLSLITNVNESIKSVDKIENLISEQYQLKIEDVHKWIENVNWRSENEPINPFVIEEIIQTLKNTLPVKGVAQDVESDDDDDNNMT